MAEQKDGTDLKEKLRYIFQKKVIEARNTYAIASVVLTAGAILSGSVEIANKLMGHPLPEGAGTIGVVSLATLGMSAYLYKNRTGPS